VVGNSNVGVNIRFYAMSNIINLQEN